MRIWGQVMGTGLGIGALAGAGQLGVGYGLGLVRLARDFPTDGGWSAQLTWLAWFAAVAVLVGAVAGSLVADQHGIRLVTTTRVAIVAVAGLGAAIVVPLSALPAQSATVVGMASPATSAAVAAGLGALLGVVTAATALAVRLVAVSVALLVLLASLIGLVSALGWLIPGGNLPQVRLAVLDLPAVGGGNRAAVAVIGVPLVALLVAAGVAAAARSRGLPPLPTAVAATAAPGFLALTYLIGSPGTGDRAVQTAPYAASLIAVAVGLLGALLVGVARMPAPRTAESPLPQVAPPPERFDPGAPDEPAATEPEAAEPEASEPEASELGTDQLDTTTEFSRPDFSPPDFGRPTEFSKLPEFGWPEEPEPVQDVRDRAEPDPAEPDLAEPDIAEPDIAEPGPAARLEPPQWARFDREPPPDDPAPAPEPAPVPAAWSALPPLIQEPEPVVEAEAKAEAEAETPPSAGRRLRLPRLGRKSKRQADADTDPGGPDQPQPVEAPEPVEDAVKRPPAGAAERSPRSSGRSQEVQAPPEQAAEEPPAPTSSPPAPPPKPVRPDEEEHLDWISSLASREDDEELSDTGRRRLRRDHDLGMSTDDLPEPPARRKP